MTRVKADAGKPRLSLLPWSAWLAAGELLTRKAVEHGDAGGSAAWRNMPHEAYREALLRHVALLASGDDSEDHLLAVFTNAGIEWAIRRAEGVKVFTSTPRATCATPPDRP